MANEPLLRGEFVGAKLHPWAYFPSHTPEATMDASWDLLAMSPWLQVSWPSIPGHVAAARAFLSWDLSRKRIFSGGGKALRNLHLKKGEAAFGSKKVFLLQTFLFGAFLYI